MKKGDVYKTKNNGRQSSATYVRVLEVFKPGTYQYDWEKDKRSELKGVKGIFIKYERSSDSKFTHCYTNYMKRTDFLYHFKEKLGNHTTTE